MKPNALIAGSTGLVGKELLTLLAASSCYDSIHLLVRRQINTNFSEVQSHLVDFSNLDDFIPETVIRDVYVCLGTTQKKAGGQAGFFKIDHDYVMNLARWAKRNHVERLCIISSIGANPKSTSFYLKTKGKVEEELKVLDFKHLCIVRPSLLLGKRNEHRWAEDLAAKIYPAISFLLVGGLKKYRAVQASKVAAAMFHYLTTMTEPCLIVESDKISDL